MLIFVDTEYTNFQSPKLISIGLVAETGEEAYFEIECDRRDCSDFVREIVIPLMGRESNALISKDMLARV